MVGTGLGTGHMKFQLLEHKLNQTVLILGDPNFFLIFQSKNFSLQKNFSYICDPDKRIRQWQLQVTSTAMV
jgi:hypothetical protein